MKRNAETPKRSAKKQKTSGRKKPVKKAKGTQTQIVIGTSGLSVKEIPAASPPKKRDSAVSSPKRPSTCIDPTTKTDTTSQCTKGESPPTIVRDDAKEHVSSPLLKKPKMNVASQEATKQITKPDETWIPPPLNQVSPKGHPEGALDAMLKSVARRVPDKELPTDLAIQVNEIDYVLMQVPMDGVHDPAWTSEIKDVDDGCMVPYIRIFGCDESGMPVAVRIHGFEPYIYARLPDDFVIENTMTIMRVLNAKIGELSEKENEKRERGGYDGDIPGPFVVRVEVVDKYPIRGYRTKKIPFLRATLSAPKWVPTLRKILEEENSISENMPKLDTYEADVLFPLRFMINNGLTGCDWIKIATEHQSAVIRKAKTGTGPLEWEGGGYCEVDDAEKRRTCASSSLHCSSSIYFASPQYFGSSGNGRCDRIWYPPCGDTLLLNGGSGGNGGSSQFFDMLGCHNSVETACGEDRDGGGTMLERKTPEVTAKKPRHIRNTGGSTRCAVEIDIHVDGITSLGVQGDWSKHCQMRVLSFDTEWKGKGHAFPALGEDPVITICSGFAMYGEDPKGGMVPKIMVNFQVRECVVEHAGNVGEERHVVWFDDEASMMLAWRDMVIASDPDIITGYNILNFDFPYLFARAKTIGIGKRFADIGRVGGGRQNLASWREGGFSSKAQTLKKDEVTIPGRTVYDMQTSIMRGGDRLPSYKLDSVAERFLGMHKIDVGHERIGPLFMGTPEDRKLLWVYCEQDARLPLLIAAKKMTFQNGVEMARATHTPLSFQLARGNQVKVHCLILSLCRTLDTVVDSTSSKKLESGAKYKGATVVQPIPGYYPVPIVTLDYQSMYPMIMQAYNLCYSTFLTEEQAAALPAMFVLRTPTNHPFIAAPPYFTKEKLETLGLKTLDDIGLAKDVTYKVARNGLPYLVGGSDIPKTAAEKLKLESGVEYIDNGNGTVKLEDRRQFGVLPRILQELLEARKQAKFLMGKATDPSKRAVYDSRQLALKIVANSVYGFTGAQTGKLPMPIIAGSVTAYGRGQLDKTIETVEERYPGAKVVYGDTDSVMVKFAIERTVDSESAKSSLARVLKVIVEPVCRHFFPALGKVEFKWEKITAKSSLRDVAESVTLVFPDDECSKLDPTGTREPAIRLFETVATTIGENIEKVVVGMENEYIGRFRAIAKLVKESVLGCLAEHGIIVTEKIVEDAANIGSQVSCIDIAATLGTDACKYITSLLPPPSRLEFEKVYFPYLLVSKKRYLGWKWLGSPGNMKPEDHVAAMGLETQRRDNCKLVRDTLQEIFRRVMERGDIRGAIQLCRDVIAQLKAREVSLDLLSITASFSKEIKKYTAPLRHLTVVKNARRRDPASAPVLGDRVSFIMIQASKKSKSYEAVESLERVLEKKIPYDVDYYIERQLRKPITRIMKALVPCPEMLFWENITADEVIAGRIFKNIHREKIKVKAARPSLEVGCITHFLTKTGERCLKCGVLLDEGVEDALCTGCFSNQTAVLELKKTLDKKLAVSRKKLEDALVQCEKCTKMLASTTSNASGDNSAVGIGTCKNQACVVTFTKAKCIDDIEELDKKLARFSVMEKRSSEMIPETDHL